MPRTTFVALISLLVGACSAAEEPSSVGTSSNTLGTAAIGQVRPGETAGPFTCPSAQRSCAVKFQGTTGDRIDVTVTTTTPNAYFYAWIEDADTRPVDDATNGDDSRAQLHGTLKSTGTYYLYYEDIFGDPSKFTVTLHSLAAPSPESGTWRDGLAATHKENLQGTATFDLTMDSSVQGSGRYPVQVHATINLSYREPYVYHSSDSMGPRWYVETFSTDYAAPRTDPVAVHADGTFTASGGHVWSSAVPAVNASVSGSVLPGGKVHIDTFRVGGDQPPLINSAPFDMNLN